MAREVDPDGQRFKINSLISLVCDVEPVREGARCVFALFRQEDAGRGDQAGPDGRRHRRYGCADGPSHPGQAGPHRGGQQVWSHVESPSIKHSTLLITL